MRILVVEDDKKIASFVARGLKEAGFAVDQAENGEDGLHLALAHPYDTAVIDLMLPKLDGLSLIEELRKKKSADAGVDFERQAQRRRPGQRAAGRRRRLFDEAVFLRRAVGAGPGTYSQCMTRNRADPACRR